MKFVIAVDCEGPACVVGNEGKALSDSCDFLFAREQATLETNASIRALFDSGADQVWVWDSHGQGINLMINQLDPRCRIILGKGFNHRFPILDKSFSGVLMIGYHAMEGTKNAVLAHTYSSDAYKRIRVNNCTVGEIALDASVAGEMGVPLIFIASDSKGCEEALKVMPWVESVSTKQGFGRNCALSKHPATVQDEIYTRVRCATKNINTMKPFTFKPPIRVEIKFKTVLQSLKAIVYRRRGWKLKTPRTIEKRLASMQDWNC